MDLHASSTEHPATIRRSSCFVTAKYKLKGRTTLLHRDLRFESMLVLGFVAAAAFSLTAAAPFVERSTPGVVNIPLSHRKSTAPRFINSTRIPHESAHRRRDEPETSLQFTGERYFVDYEIAGQTISAILDTGSSDTWAFATGASGSNLFDPSSAKSGYKWVNNDFEDAYGDGSNTVHGSWGEATITLGGASVDNYPFAYLNQSDILFPDNRGIFGISVWEAEAADPPYTPFVQRLKEQGTISSNAFSLYLSNEDATEAELILGGIDSAKYDGQLYTVPWSSGELDILSAYYGVDFEVEGQKLSGVFDTGTPQILLPQNIADSLAEEYGFYWNDYDQAYETTIKPDFSGKKGIDFNFSGVNITVPTEDLILEESEGIYLFSVARSIDEIFFSLNILGDPILRQLYLVFDLDNKQYALAPVKYTDDSNVQAITTSIPGAKAAPGS